MLVAGNTVSAIVFWPEGKQPPTATPFLLICLAIIDNLTLFFCYLVFGVTKICNFYHTCHYYMKVRRLNMSGIYTG